MYVITAYSVTELQLIDAHYIAAHASKTHAIHTEPSEVPLIWFGLKQIIAKFDNLTWNFWKVESEYGYVAFFFLWTQSILFLPIYDELGEYADKNETTKSIWTKLL